MQVALLVPQAEWQALVDTVQRLEAARATAAEAAEDPILSVRQTAQALGLTEEAVRRARRAGRLKGVRRNEKEWGFRRSVVEAYPRRYERSAA
jgi:hypothetical protein